jgi:hypothetical protein
LNDDGSALRDTTSQRQLHLKIQSIKSNAGMRSERRGTISHQETDSVTLTVLERVRQYALTKGERERHMSNGVGEI